jgi:hypothetical protein
MVTPPLRCPEGTAKRPRSGTMPGCKQGATTQAQPCPLEGATGTSVSAGCAISVSARPGSLRHISIGGRDLGWRRGGAGLKTRHLLLVQLIGRRSAYRHVAPRRLGMTRRAMGRHRRRRSGRLGVGYRRRSAGVRTGHAHGVLTIRKVAVSSLRPRRCGNCQDGNHGDASQKTRNVCNLPCRSHVLSPVDLCGGKVLREWKDPRVGAA